ncbi:amino acid adenylation domain-containing protein [Streptomyces sp. NPDC127106]|uniref:non-ribosomal peptide synthetase n=1 Tax=Streptomyces sp. NPDC127106 TaxID=3345360 RepID=UPI00362BE840
MTTHPTTPATAGTPAATAAAAGTTPAAAYRRPVSPTERLYLGAGHARGAMALRVVVEGDGLPGREQLQAAVARAADACPGSRLVRRGPLWVADGPPPRVTYADPTAAAFDASAPATAELLTGRSGPADPPGCEVLAVPGRGGTPTALVFSASHALMDGHGALTWVREVFRALRGEPAQPATDPATDHGLLRSLPADRRRRRPAPLPGLPSPLGPAAPGTPPRTLWLRRTLPGRHPALTARLAQAVADAAGRETRVMVPVDLRRHRPHLAAATGNLTLPLFLDLRPGEDWARAQSRLLAALADGAELAAGFEAGLVARLPSAAVAALLRAAQAASVRADRHLASAVVSHLGVLDPAELSGGGFTATTAYALPVHAPLVPLSFAVAETAAASEITLGVRASDPFLREHASAFLDTVLATAATATATAATATATAATATAATATAATASATSAPAPAASAPVTAVSSGRPHAAADGAGGPNPSATVVDLFRAQAARTPAAVALDGPDGAVTYAELDRRSDAVAADLVRRGAGRGSLVGLVVDRTPDGVCALWGILKAGAAYVPLDPGHPGPRIREVLEAGGVRLTLTRRHLAADLVDSVPGTLLPVENVLAEAEAEANADADPDPDRAGVLPVGPAPGDLAYVMHTSGSTGRPKGVLIEHRGLVAFVHWMTATCRVDADTRFGFAASYAFDISCFPLFLPLLAGGTAVLAPGAPSPAVLRALVGEHRADTLALTPSHLALLDGDGGGRLRTLLLGGEELTPASVRSAYAAFGSHCRVINGYGPTEATVACLAHVVDGTETGPSVPLGTAGPGAHVDLVGEDGEVIGTGPADTGRVGEIVVRGPQVARGYLGAGDLDTAADGKPRTAGPVAADGAPSSLPATPFSAGPDRVRSYRTGDLGRRLPGGAIAFAGRADGQLKISGYRIEPAEVIAALEAHPTVARAAVTARRRPGARSAVLCAYVILTGTPDDPADPGAAKAKAEAGTGVGTAADLRAELTRTLPRHLVPAHVIAVPALPTTISGKTDFDALPDPFARTPRPDTPDADATDATDASDDSGNLRARVAGHWAAILGVDASDLTPDSDFQALGGDSLALVEMITAVSADLLTPDQARRFTEDLACLVRDLTLGQVCARLTTVREETPA